MTNVFFFEFSFQLFILDYVVLSLADSHSSIFVNYLENRTCSVVKVSTVGEYLDEDV